MNRRTLLAAFPALTVPAIPALAAPNAESPVEALLREWIEIDRECEAFFAAKPVLEADDPRTMQFTRRKEVVELQMREAPKHSLTDLAITIMCSSDIGTFGLRMKDAARCGSEWKELVHG